LASAPVDPGLHVKRMSADSGVPLRLQLLILLRRRWGLQALLLATVAPVLHFFSPFYLAFWAGLALAWLDSIFEFRIPVALGLILSAVGIYGLGYVESVGAYHWLPQVNTVSVHAFAAAVLLFAVTRCELMTRCLDVPLGRLLGRYSFPIYLLHVLILMSLGMLVFLLLFDVTGRGIAMAISILSTVLGTLAVAHLLAKFEQWWIRSVHHAALSISFLRCDSLLTLSLRKPIIA